MSIGYACLAVGVPNTGMKGCIMKNADNRRLMELTGQNLKSLNTLTEYNIKNGIRLFRISSDLIPFGSNPVNRTRWREEYAEEFAGIGMKIRQSGMRVSMHPGQYTVLNSPDEGVVLRAVEDLAYHAAVLDALELGPEHKIILHIGGVYGDKEEASRRFVRNYRLLPENVKSRLVIENDDRSFRIGDVLEIGNILEIPVIFDNLHNQINACEDPKSEEYWIRECRKTWKVRDGKQKIHYSQQNRGKNPGAHSDTIGIAEFMDFYNRLEDKTIDIMLEVKDKNLSAVKCINCTMEKTDRGRLEAEWSRYKYLVLEKAQEDYLAIRRLFRDSKSPIAVPFYEIVERAALREEDVGNFINAAQHVWGYFKDVASEREKSRFTEELAKYEAGEISGRRIKAGLWKLAVKYQRSYLLESYYFL
ncbi:UV DNA damage repair endonuclease UvsE [Anaerobium acetethylicum]|uniref:UV DNA damage endonuclease n=1 Tax=Anaerobium acetethylicum TaxID=1619234 RepID=A0A1D3TQ03_9FIRM|nr:UV DNA damage repair endonuclease UvsE [Anaerobium acetethylicum]SCP95633.1 UV DNA damage endonuclease [Anaerobium acetethylicum]